MLWFINLSLYTPWMQVGEWRYHHYHQLYSPWWALASFTTLLHPALSSTLPVQPLTPITTSSNHLVHGCPFLLLENNLPFNILLGIRSSDILSTCPSHVSSVLSRTLQYHALQSVHLILHYSVFSIHIYPILLSKDLRTFSSATVSDHVSAPYVMTGHTNVL